MHTLETENFSVCIEPEILEADTDLPINTLLKIEVRSDGFAANTTMDINIKDLAQFGYDLSQIQKTLQGDAALAEPYGKHMYLSFSGSGRGHIAVKGCLHKGSRAGWEQTLEFENDIDQTCLEAFSLELLSHYGKYLHR